MKIIKRLSVVVLFGLLWVTPASAEIIGGGSPNSNSLFQQVWTFFFG